MTVGSLRTIPRPLAYTSVFAVPKSMARSLARPTLPPRRPPLGAAVPVGIRGERLELPREPLHVCLHGPRLAVTEPQDQAPQQRENDGNAEVDEVRHRVSPRPLRRDGCTRPSHCRPPTSPSSRWGRCP